MNPQLWNHGYRGLTVHLTRDSRPCQEWVCQQPPCYVVQGRIWPVPLCALIPLDPSCAISHLSYCSSSYPVYPNILTAFQQVLPNLVPHSQLLCSQPPRLPFPSSAYPTHSLLMALHVLTLLWGTFPSEVTWLIPSPHVFVKHHLLNRTCPDHCI